MTLIPITIILKKYLLINISKELNFENISSKINELHDISNFIKKNWNKNHILATNKSYFSYLFKSKKKLNFIVCRDASNSLIGILGFIKSSYTTNTSIWTSMWMVKKNNTPMLGIKMLMKLIKNKNMITLCLLE